MKTVLDTKFVVDKDAKKINVERPFNAPVDKVWAAWTQKDILDKWWAPKPWKAETKSQEFAKDGHWLYAMVGPEGEKHWGIVKYLDISPLNYFTGSDSFCDENGVLNPAFATNTWKNEFISERDKTVVKIELSFEKVEDLEQIIEMGFKEGFISALGNLDDLL